MNRLLPAALAALLLASAPSFAQSSGALSFGKPKAAESTELVTVQAKGQGASVEAAKKDAIRNAIKTAVGELVDAKTLVENDELVEDRILTLSNAMIEKADYGKAESAGDGLWEISVTAVVRKGPLNKELEAVGIATGAVAGDSLAATMFTGKERLANAEKFFEECFKGFPGNIVEAVMLTKSDGTPAIAPDPETDHVFAYVTLRVNMDNYSEWAKRAQQLFEMVCVSKEKTTLVFKDSTAVFAAKRSERTGPFPVVLATPKKVERDSWEASVYYLDGQIYKVLEKALKARLPETGAIEVSLADKDGNAVRSARMSLSRAKFIGGYFVGSMDPSCPAPFPMAGRTEQRIDSSLAIVPYPMIASHRQSIQGVYIYRQKRNLVAWRLDLGEMSEDDLAEVAGYEVKVEYK